MKSLRFFFSSRKLFLAKSRAYFLLLIMDGRPKVVYPIILLHLGFQKPKERAHVESLEAGRGGWAPCGPELPGLRLSVCGRQDRPQRGHLLGVWPPSCPSKMPHCTEPQEAWGNVGEKAHSRKLGGNRAGGLAGDRSLAWVLSQDRDPLGGGAHMHVSALSLCLVPAPSQPRHTLKCRPGSPPPGSLPRLPVWMMALARPSWICLLTKRLGSITAGRL